ncbi:MAG: toxin-antitoxin system HicB family antitoxin [Terriglobia bacterium]
MKKLEDYLLLNYRMSLYRDEEGDYIAEIGELPGCVAHGVMPEEAVQSLEQAKRVWMESRWAAGLEIPEPRLMDGYSGKLLVRMPRYLHRWLSERASVEGVSLNQYVVSLLSHAAGEAQHTPLEAQNVLLHDTASELGTT